MPALCRTTRPPPSIVATWALVAATTTAALAQARRDSQPADQLTKADWEQLDLCVDRGLAWLARQQRSDGSFPSIDAGQPAVTALCGLAFLSRGHTPGEGKYGPVLDRAIAYVLQCQYDDGLIAKIYPSMPVETHNPSHTSNYNHAIGGLFLGEVVGMTNGKTNTRIREAIRRAIEYCKKRVPSPKRNADDRDGWRYGQSKGPPHDDSDLSVTNWQLMFLRSCRNAGFDVPVEYIDEALAFVRRCYDTKLGLFRYALHNEKTFSAGMAGAGILSLSLAGEHKTEMAQRAGQALVRRPMRRFGQVVSPKDRFFYACFYCSQATYQLGEPYWSRYYRPMFDVLRHSQTPVGAWPPEPWEEVFGNCYSSAMAILTMTPPYQLLPIFQR